MGAKASYVPALRFAALTPLYDAVTSALTREAEVKRRLVLAAGIGDGTRVLDLGCGSGTLLLEVARVAPRARLTGVDSDRTMLDRAQAKARRAGVELELVEGRAEALPFPDGSFDRVVSSLFFHHLLPEAKVAAAREARRMLAPGGELWVSDWGPPRSLAGRLGFGLVRLLDGFERTRDSRRGLLAERLRAAGFAEVELIAAEPTPLGWMDLYRARPE